MRRPSYLIAGAAALLLAIGGGALLLRNSEPPAAIQDLERAQSASKRASEQRDRIIANLDRIRENLAAGAGLSKRSQAIDELTQKQVDSLRELETLLRDQLAVLDRTQGALGSTSEAAESVAELGERQIDLLRVTLQALKDLRERAESATKISRTFAQRALYGAKLAEDSERAFRRP